MHRKAARLPSGKTFDAWDPKASAIPGDAQWALRTLDWIGRAENFVLIGPPGPARATVRLKVRSTAGPGAQTGAGSGGDDPKVSLAAG